MRCSICSALTASWSLTFYFHDGGIVDVSPCCADCASKYSQTFKPGYDYMFRPDPTVSPGLEAIQMYHKRIADMWNDWEDTDVSEPAVVKNNRKDGD